MVRDRKRGGWVVLFMLSPLIGLVGAAVTAMVWPWALLSGALLGLSGYEIWRADHLVESARYELGWRLRRLALAAVTIGLGLVIIALVGAAIEAGVAFIHASVFGT